MVQYTTCARIKIKFFVNYFRGNVLSVLAEEQTKLGSYKVPDRKLSKIVSTWERVFSKYDVTDHQEKVLKQASDLKTLDKFFLDHCSFCSCT